MTNPVLSASRSSHALPSFHEHRSCEQWQLWARENRKVNNNKGMAPLRSRSCRTTLLQDDVDPVVLKHMTQLVSKSSKVSSLREGKTEKTATQKQRIHTSRSFRSSLQNNDSERNSKRSLYENPAGKVEYQSSPPVKGEPGESFWSGFSVSERDRQRRADVAIEEQQEQQTGSHGGGNDDFCLEYTHSMILQQEAILAEIRREELKQEAIRKKLLEEQAYSSSSRASYMTGGNYVSAKKHDLSLTGGNDAERHAKDISPVKKNQSSRTSKEQPATEMRIHGGRRVKVFPETRVQEAIERGESVYLLRCIECDKQLLATKDLHTIFCSNCESIFPTLLGKELCSTRL